MNAIKGFVVQDGTHANDFIYGGMRSYITDNWQQQGSRIETALEALKLAKLSYRFYYTVNTRTGGVTSVCAWKPIPVYGADLAAPFNNFSGEIQSNINKIRLWSIFIGCLAGNGEGGTQYIMAALKRLAQSTEQALHLHSSDTAKSYYKKLGFRTFNGSIFFYIPPSVETKIFPEDLL